MALIGSTTTRSTIVCLMVVALVVFATISFTLPCCHAGTESTKKVVCETLDACISDAGCKAICEGSGMVFYYNACAGRDFPICCCIPM
ncbi:uncharacterized protein LOC119273380 [Triticum dicoccoides]|uniref:uncharacterized protein LOC119273380 n=1 Tax=Triticum dicoccoides TaxID=85692 RepID=UPI000E7B3F92|nr:uncharacterized protein LOC119273380 [Triticum dicoccoides]